MTSVDLDQPSNLREQALFGLTMLVLVFFVYRLAFLSSSAKVTELGSRAKSLVLEKNALAKFVASAPTPKAGELGYRKGIQGIRSKLLSGEIKASFQDISSFLSQLTDPRFLGEVHVVDLKYSPPVQEQGYSSTAFHVVMQGSFGEIMRTLERMEPFPALFSLDSVSFKTAAGQVLDLVAEIDGRFFQLGGSPAPSPQTASKKASATGGKP